MMNSLFVSTSWLEQLAETMPTGYAYLLVYLFAKSAERVQNKFIVTNAVLGRAVGLTKASVRRALKRFERLGHIKTDFDDRHRTNIHIYNIARNSTGVNKRSDSGPIAAQERSDSGAPHRRAGDLEAQTPLDPPLHTSPSLIPPDIREIISTRKGSMRGNLDRPTPDQINAYAVSIGVPEFDGVKFCDHYESNGWKVGRNPMKNWQAAVRTWVRMNPRPFKELASRSKEHPPQEPLPSREELVQAADVHDLVLKLAGGKNRRLGK